MAYTTEEKIARRIISDALAKGWTISVYDGGSWTVNLSTDLEYVFAALQSTGEDTLRLRAKPEDVPNFESLSHMGDVYLIWGNGSDLISDYSDKLDEFIAPINKWAEELAE